MHETALSFAVNHRNKILKLKPPVPNSEKLRILLIILMLSYLSGKVAFLNDLGRNRQSVEENEAVLSSVVATQDYSQESIMAKEKQIRQIAIGQQVTLRSIAEPAQLEAGNSWGVAKQVDTHTYTMRVRPDTKIGTPREIMDALNSYRRQHGSGDLAWDDNLANFANKRASYFTKNKDLDGHAGFMDYLDHEDGFKKLGFSTVGENSSLGFTLEGVHLIEWVYAGDEGHNSNQLNKDWRYVGVGVDGSATDLVFGGSKL